MKNIYTCMQCHDEFESPIELKILWFCSNSHKFKYAFNVATAAFPAATKEAKFKFTKKIVEVWL